MSDDARGRQVVTVIIRRDGPIGREALRAAVGLALRPRLVRVVLADEGVRLASTPASGAAARALGTLAELGHELYADAASLVARDLPPGRCRTLPREELPLLLESSDVVQGW